jgi:hypothetical protein
LAVFVVFVVFVDFVVFAVAAVADFVFVVMRVLIPPRSRPGAIEMHHARSAQPRSGRR